MAVTAAQDSLVTSDTGRATSQALIRTTAPTGPARTDEATAQGQAQAARRPTNLLDLPDEVLEQILLWSTNFWKTPTAGRIDYLLVNKRIWRIGFAVRMSRLCIERKPDVHLRQLSANQQQSAVVRALRVEVSGELLPLMTVAVANLPLLSEVFLSLDVVDDVEGDHQRRAAALCLKTLTQRSSLTEIGTFSFEGLRSEDFSDLPNFPPSLHRLDLQLSDDLTELFLRRCASLQTLSVSYWSSVGTANVWDAAANLHVTFRHWYEFMADLVESQLQQSLLLTNSQRSPLRSLSLHIDPNYHDTSDRTARSAQDMAATIITYAASSAISGLEVIQASGASWPTLGDDVSLPNVKILQLVVDGMGDTHEAEGWPSLARFLSHFPSLIRLVIDITAYESVMYTTSIPHKPISMKKLAARLEPQRLAAEQPLLAQLLVFLRSTSVLQLYIRRTWLRGHELRATRATRDDDFSFERWDVTKLQM
ncbi:hypothetical protein OF846_003703 [Rhodotorula toruloides]|nr:hypothetical protein OF846_003703 [Rhodotorula toruloides]